jgi:uncharacterized protein YggU (UPF0235/DUF167 family)
MKIIVKAKPGAKLTKVEESTPAISLFSRQKDLRTFKVWVKEKAVHGAANEGVINALADFFDIPKSRVRLLSGGISKEKIFEIDL